MSNEEFLKSAHIYQSTGRSLVHLYQLLCIAETAQSFNPSPVDIIESLRRIDLPIVLQARKDLEEIFIRENIDPKKTD